MLFESRSPERLNHLNSSSSSSAPLQAHSATLLPSAALPGLSDPLQHRQMSRSSSADSQSRVHSEAIAPGVNPTPDHDLIFHGGKTIQNLNFANIYVGGSQSWNQSDANSIDNALAAAMSDTNLNNVMAQYFPSQQITSKFLGSTFLQGQAPTVVSQAAVENTLSSFDSNGTLGNNFDLSSTVFNFMLPSGTILTNNENDNSQQGLGGYHGSVHVANGNGGQDTIYYAVGVYSQASAGQTNGIPAFNQSWKNVAATFYHELNEARTDANVEDAQKTGNNSFLGWMSQKGEECGDFPINEAFTQVFKEVPLTNGSGIVPVQFMYSNAVHGPEGPIAAPHPYQSGGLAQTVQSRPYAEKAYAQFAEAGVTQRPAADSTTSYVQNNYHSIAGTYPDGIAYGHEHALFGANITDDPLTSYNPWGNTNTFNSPIGTDDYQDFKIIPNNNFRNDSNMISVA